MQMLLIFLPLLLVPVLHRAGGYGRGIKPGTDEFRQAASRPGLAEVWGCLFQHRTQTLTFIYPQGSAVSIWQADGKANYCWASWQQKATKSRQKKSVTQPGRTVNGQRQSRVLARGETLVHMEMLRRKSGGEVMKKLHNLRERLHWLQGEWDNLNNQWLTFSMEA